MENLHFVLAAMLGFADVIFFRRTTAVLGVFCLGIEGFVVRTAVLRIEAFHGCYFLLCGNIFWSYDAACAILFWLAP